ncbi:MAG: hypothetical protein U5K43_03950 [Halofilum sp. (in: g-proteobacteria)]|nr:hypothetical protein [Halofilum sp. (in: g-proteobacteria)]
MQSRAAALGEELVRRERALDRLFADGTPDAEAVAAAVARAAETRGRLRTTHLQAHLEQRRGAHPGAGPALQPPARLWRRTRPTTPTGTTAATGSTSTDRRRAGGRGCYARLRIARSPHTTGNAP